MLLSAGNCLISTHCADGSNVCCVNFDLTSGDMKTLATAYSACSGHGKNQSMLVLLTIPVSDTYGRYGKQTQQARVSINVSRQADIKTFRKNTLYPLISPPIPALMQIYF